MRRQNRARDLLAFVDADILIHPDTFIVIDHFLSSDAIVGGTSGATLDRWSAVACAVGRLLGHFVPHRIDTGVVYCRAPTSSWWAVRRALPGSGGRRVPGVSLAPCMDARAMGGADSAHHGRVVHAKFAEHGDWHYYKMLAAFRGITTKGGPGAAWVDEYWYQPKR